MNAWPSFLMGRSNSALVGELVADCEAVGRERGHAAAHSADKSAACSSESLSTDARTTLIVSPALSLTAAGLMRRSLTSMLTMPRRLSAKRVQMRGS